MVYSWKNLDFSITKCLITRELLKITHLFDQAMTAMTAAQSSTVLSWQGTMYLNSPQSIFPWTTNLSFPVSCCSSRIDNWDERMGGLECLRLAVPLATSPIVKSELRSVVCLELQCCWAIIISQTHRQKQQTTHPTWLIYHSRAGVTCR